jgi:hypothetical protein
MIDTGVPSNNRDTRGGMSREEAGRGHGSDSRVIPAGGGLEGGGQGRASAEEEAANGEGRMMAETEIDRQTEIGRQTETETNRGPDVCEVCVRDRSETDRDKQTETETHRGWPHRGPGVCEICVRDKRSRVRLSKWGEKGGGGGGEGPDVSNTVLGVMDIVKRTCLIVWAGPLFVSVDIISSFSLPESAGGRWCFSCCPLFYSFLSFPIS